MEKKSALPLEFVVKGPPVSQQTRRGERRRAWIANVRQQAQRRWPKDAAPVAVSVMLSISYFYDSVSVDVDNVIKPIQDALKGLVYEDDVQVTDVLSRRRNLSGDFRVNNVSAVLADALGRGDEFLHVVVEEAPDQGVLG